MNSFELTQEHRDFPPHLRHFAWCPERIYLRGDIRTFRRGVGIIGARKATPYGKEAARIVASWCAEFDIPVYSGAAMGCDQAAHRGALEAGGDTVAVLGCGADRYYPASARDLIDRIVEQGCVASLMEWGAKPRKQSFVERNRLIVAMSYLLVVVEGRMPSGTFSAVNWADQLNVDIAAVPGSIFSPESTGPNHLLSNGAVPIASKDDFMSALALSIDYEDTGEPLAIEDWELQALDSNSRKIMHALRSGSLSIEAVGQCLDVPLIESMVAINILEVKGLVQRLDDGRFVACT
ncbi:MAG: DNA-protecting protein DprA [Coriobacteriia bacterium]|nr:DNA-protecting protein DprA [Coriobacteriia bacterium]